MAVIPAAARLLVAAQPPPLPAEFATVDLPLVNGLPAAIPLGAVATALLIAPTGLARAWQDADPALPVSQSVEQTTAAAADAPAAATGARPPLRLLVRRTDGALIGVVPLVARLPMALPLAEERGGPAVEIVLLRWDVRAGNLRGPGDVGGRLTLAWRRTDRSVERFASPPMHPMVAARSRFDDAAPEAPRQPTSPLLAIGWLDRFESEIGLAERARRRRLIRGYTP